MADKSKGPAVLTPVQMVETDAEGYCDPVTGACMLPGPAKTEVDHTEDAETPASRTAGTGPSRLP